MNRKNFLLILSFILTLLIAVGCNKTQKPNDIKFYYPNGVPALTVAKLTKENPGISEDITIDYEMQESPDTLVSKIMKGEADIAIVPSNLAAQAFNKGIPYKLVGTSVWGSFYITSTEDIKNFKDLKGREIYSIGRGLTPDIVLQYILSNNGLDPNENVEINYLNAESELGPAFIGGKTNLAVLPEPLATNIMMEKGNAKVIFNLNEEWKDITGNANGYPQASLIIKQDLLENNRDFIEKFLKEYKKSQEWALENPERLGDYANDLEISIKKETIIEGQNRMNINFVETKDCKKEYEIFFKVILDFAPEFIGNKLPNEEFYFER